MGFIFHEKSPIFNQIAQQLEEAIFVGGFLEESQIPSTTEISTLYKINPATILKGMNLLVDEGILYKKRGLGMFVTSGAVEKIGAKRKALFLSVKVNELVEESKKLGLGKAELLELIEKRYG